jgi:hypothetical protein
MVLCSIQFKAIQLLTLMFVLVSVFGLSYTQLALADSCSNFRPLLIPSDVDLSVAASLKVTACASSGSYALVSWVWDESGGEAILQQSQGIWTVLENSGGVMDSPFLIQLGVPSNTAVQLTQTLDQELQQSAIH